MKEKSSIPQVFVNISPPHYAPIQITLTHSHSTKYFRIFSEHSMKRAYVHTTTTINAASKHTNNCTSIYSIDVVYNVYVYMQGCKSVVCSMA